MIWLKKSTQEEIFVANFQLANFSFLIAKLLLSCNP